jgi:4-hydroxybutyrate CoA-transferase
MKITSAQNALAHIESGNNIFIHTAAAAPSTLISALMNSAEDLNSIKIYQLHTEGEAPYAEEKWKNHFEVNALFIGANVRKAIHKGYAHYIPVFLHEAPGLFRNKKIDLDIALISVSPPDKFGFCSLGISVDVSLAAVQSARIVIAQIVPDMPRTFGDGFIHESEIDFAVITNDQLQEVKSTSISETDKEIAKNIASLIEDAATLQFGIGSVPNAVMEFLSNHKNLGIHSEMITDSILELIKKGVINGEEKNIDTGKIVCSFAMGTKELYYFMHDNPEFLVKDATYVNHPNIISLNHKVTAINSALEIDLSGQICADSIGTQMYSGVGGQVDFVRGAALSKVGKSIIAMSSTSSKGESKISSCLKTGAGVVTTRADIRFVVTEFGIADLFGKNLRERAKSLIAIANPAFRDKLEREAELFRNIYFFG